MFEPEIRVALTEDIGQILDLETSARTHLIDQRGGVRWLEQNPPTNWDEVVPQGTVSVACIDAVVLGYLVWEAASDSVAEIRQVYVEPMARGIGCGDGLMAFTIEQARSGGYHYLEGQALPGDRETKNLYERAGITARLITVSTKL
jgi:GNAT superfamily N-acetyltransferase